MKTSVTFGIPGVASMSKELPDGLLDSLGLLAEPLAIVKRDAGGLAFDTGLETASGSPLMVWHLHCEDHQLWQLDRCGDDASVSIRSLATGLVLGAERKTLGTAVTMQRWSGKTWQKWHIRQANPPRTYSISSADPELRNMSMDVSIDAAPGDPVQLWESADAQQQMFMLLRTKY